MGEEGRGGRGRGIVQCSYVRIRPIKGVSYRVIKECLVLWSLYATRGVVEGRVSCCGANAKV